MCKPSEDRDPVRTLEEDITVSIFQKGEADEVQAGPFEEEKDGIGTVSQHFSTIP